MIFLYLFFFFCGRSFSEHLAQLNESCRTSELYNIRHRLLFLPKFSLCFYKADHKSVTTFSAKTGKPQKIPVVLNPYLGWIFTQLHYTTIYLKWTKFVFIYPSKSDISPL